jgi:hypothetical protein
MKVEEPDTPELIQQLCQRLDELESRVAIGDLVTDYCRGFDSRDWARFISIWHEDCIWELGPAFGSFRNHDGVREGVNAVLYPIFRESHHLATNHRIEFDGPDNARGVCDVDCMAANHDDVVIMAGVSYLDDYQRRDGIWKILRREMVIHYFNPMPGLEMSVPG